ncbi:putative secreted protein with PEP-CTERM sorting signal [Pseudoduganella lurida]|uniref:Putative secreted protein with PEP-CTERM sorting signal n=1 Tax=Pseudoduganella lurida TaxID=1036180 RepID=A0A562R7R1_9BURK|nr:FxDxF family PEP-CTERM protein [Pseudoduganella lurida]TWI65112.1 putative secreted protein with PEP-CTERM sorting signal [Pseudoduganella lurida]
MKLKFAVASLLAVASMSAFAADQTIVLNTAGLTHFSTENTVDVLGGGSDTLTFVGAPAGGLYDVYIGITGQYLNWDVAGTTLNGVSGSWDSSGKVVKFIGIETTATSPFVLNLAGSLTGKGVAGYDGNISISAVPEPTTYGMLLGGLGIMGFLARRKAKKA